MILPSIAESHENMIFTSSVFTKMLFFMKYDYFVLLAEWAKSEILNHKNLSSHIKKVKEMLIFGDNEIEKH